MKGPLRVLLLALLAVVAAKEKKATPSAPAPESAPAPAAAKSSSTPHQHNGPYAPIAEMIKDSKKKSGFYNVRAAPVTVHILMPSLVAPSDARLFCVPSCSLILHSFSRTQLLKKMREVKNSDAKDTAAEAKKNATRKALNGDMQRLLGDEVYQKYRAVRVANTAKAKAAGGASHSHTVHAGTTGASASKPKASKPAPATEPAPASSTSSSQPKKTKTKSKKPPAAPAA